MLKAYVLIEKGYEYDDNYYNEHGDGGGNPKTVLFDKDFAKSKCRDLEIKRHKTENISEYCPGGIEDYVDNVEEFEKFLDSLIQKYGPIKKQSKWDTINKYRLHPLSNREEEDKYLSYLDGYLFYDICETDIDKESLRDSQVSYLTGH